MVSSGGPIMTKQLTYRRAKHRPQAVELKGVVWFGLGIISLFAYSIWATGKIYADRQYAEIGRAVICEDRPSYEYFRFCNPQADGVACTMASQSRMLEFYEPIDYACAKGEPERPFVFPTNSDRMPTMVADAT